MLKTLLLVLAGLVAGLAIAFWLQPSSAPTAEPKRPTESRPASRASAAG